MTEETKESVTAVEPTDRLYAMVKAPASGLMFNTPRLYFRDRDNNTYEWTSETNQDVFLKLAKDRGFVLMNRRDRRAFQKQERRIQADRVRRDRGDKKARARLIALGVAW